MSDWPDWVKVLFVVVLSTGWTYVGWDIRGYVERQRQARARNRP